MTTSFSVNRNEIINAALRATGKIGLTQTVPAELTINASQAFNIMIKQWMAKGVTLWKIREVIVALVPNINKYPLGPTAAYVSSVPVLTGGAAYTSGSQVLFSAPVAFSGWTGTAASGVLELLAGVVTGVTITSGGGGYTEDNPPIMTVGAPGSGATFGDPVLAGTTVQRPMRVLDQGNFIRDLSTPPNYRDVSINLLARTDYEMYGSKFSLGVVNSIFYDPQLTNGQLYVYTNVADDSVDRELHLFCQLPFEDMDEATTTPDFPQEWFAPLKWGLARELVTELGCDETTERRIKEHYQETLSDGLNNSVDEASAYFTYDTRGRG